MHVLDELCPYNYEAIELLLGQLDEWTHQRGLYASNQQVLQERILLLRFLK